MRDLIAFAKTGAIGRRDHLRPVHLGPKQLEALEALGPQRCPIVADRTHRRLIEIGLADGGDDGSFVCLTPAGLRKLADEIDAGRAQPLRERMIASFKARLSKEQKEPHR